VAEGVAGGSTGAVAGAGEAGAGAAEGLTSGREGEAAGGGLKVAGAMVTWRGAGVPGAPRTRSPAASLRPLMPAMTFLVAGLMLLAGCLQL